MRKLLIFIIVFCFVKVCSGQVTPIGTPYPINQNLGRNASTLVSTNAIRFDQGLILGHFQDTAQANLLPYLKNYPYTIISVDTNIVLMRNWNATKWMFIPTAGQIINGDTIEYIIDVSRPPGQTNVYLKYFNGFTTYERVGFVDSVGVGISSLTNFGVTTSTYNSTTGVLNIPKDQRVGKYLNLGKTYTDFKPILFGGSMVFAGNSWAAETFTQGTPWPTQLATFYNKTKVITAVTGDDLSWWVRRNWPNVYGRGVDSIFFCDIQWIPLLGQATTGNPTGGFYYSDGLDETRTMNYIYGSFKSFMANYYLDSDWFSVSSLADANFRDAVAADSLFTKSTTGSIGLGAFQFTKPAGKTSLVIGTYGADGTRVNQGTITVTLDGNTIFTKNFDTLNIANKANTLAIKAGLNYEAIVLQNLPSASGTVVVTASGDSTRFDYVGYLIPKDEVKKPLYINNFGYQAQLTSTWTISNGAVDTANQMLQNAATDFLDYPVFIQNTNNWFTLTQNFLGHLTAAGNDSVAKGYTANLLQQSYAPTHSNIATATPISSLTAASGSNTLSLGNFQQSWTSTTFDGVDNGILMDANTTATSSSEPFFGVLVRGVNASSSITSRAATIENTHSGTSSTNVGLEVSATSGTNNYAIIVPSASGSVGIGTSSPGYLLDVQQNLAGIFAASITNNSATGAGLGVNTFSTGTQTVLEALSGASGATSLFRVRANGQVDFNSTPGTSGQVLTSGGVGAPPTWTTISSGGNPAGNYGNFQLNRNGAFATTASDSLDWTNRMEFNFNGTHIASSGGMTFGSSGSTGLASWMMGNGGIDINANGIFTLSGGNSVSNIQASGLFVASATSSPGYTASTSTIHSGGSLAAAYVEKTSTYGATTNDYTINCTSGTFTVTLPTAVGITGRIYNVANSGAGVITIATTSSQTFVNVALTPTTLTLSAVGSYTVQSTGANWVVIGNL
jgi:hypothetical protein